MNGRFTIVPAVYAVLRREARILLIRRAGTGYFDGWYTLPSGHLEGGESAIAAIAREAKEEVGIDISAEDLRFVHVVHRMAEDKSHERADFFFEADAWQGVPRNCEPDKCDDIQWFDIDNLPENTIPLILHVLERVKQGKAYSDEGFNSSS